MTCKLLIRHASIALAWFAMANPANAIDLDDVQIQVFTPSCALSGCHNGVQLPNLLPGQAYNNIVDVRSSQLSLDYIEPGDPNNSYLVRKIEGTGSYNRMPPTGSLSGTNIQLVRDWVAEGALAQAADADGDGVADASDNCPDVANASQLDTDNDSQGDACDADDDGDGVADVDDARPLDPTETRDSDNDGVGDNADDDDDNDGISDAAELAAGLDPLDPNDVTGSPREILWRNAETGQNDLWSMESQYRVEQNAIRTVSDGDWKVVGMADFNGDGIDEIFFRHQVSGSNRLWTIEDGVRTSSEVVRSVSTNWFIIGMGDFDADGDADLMWRNGVTGANRYWEMDGTSRLRSAAVRSVGLTWAVPVSGDFDGDGRDDLFWRSSSGSNIVWLMQSEVRVARGVLPGVSSAWEVVGVGDFDGDGMDDVLWHNASTGSNSIWLLNGAERKFRASIPRTSLPWRPFGVLDMNGDGMADILLRNSSSGANRLWLMNGTTRTASLAIPSNPDQNWEPVAVGNTSTVEGVRVGMIGTTDAAVFFASNISTPLIQSRCIACHIEGGVATASALRYTPDAVSGHQTSNFQLLQAYVAADQAAANTILEKVRGVNHGGGLQLSSDSEDYQSLVEFLGLLGADIDDTNIPTLGDFWQGVSLASAPQTLRRAALIVAGRLPTEDELAAVESGNDAMLGRTIRDLMQGDNFHDFLVTGANDQLHTDAFFNGLSLDLAGPSDPRFPFLANKSYFDRPETEEEERAKSQWIDEWKWGLIRAPLEIIAYIVMNDRSYQEVVAADYMMVNFRTSELLNSGVEFETNDHRTYKPGRNQGQIVEDDQLVAITDEFGNNNVVSHGDFIDYPHAGVLNTHAFLGRYPSTETNRNRARARWTYFHFLGLDIEKSAKRTTDPVALADTNNPTLNNPACTVCHSIHDPMAGTFQNYGNEGMYRDQWGGKDSLPDTYKHPENYDENAEPSEYQEGDTWYRDMRTPGYEGQIAPNPENSLAWAAALIAEDPRFASAAVKFWWLALMGTKPLRAPEASEDANFAQLLEAFEEQNAFIEDLGEQFASGIDGGDPFNGKDLLTAMMMSPWFRASRIADSDSNGTAASISDYGTRRLLTPSELERKSSELLGWTWGEGQDTGAYDGVWTSLIDQYGSYYGGIDSLGIKERSRALTALMANVAEKQAFSMACPAVVVDFDRPDSERLLFGGIDTATTPATEFSETFSVTPDSFAERQSYAIQGELGANNTISISFLNNYYDEDTDSHRNLRLDSLSVLDSAGAVLLHVELEYLDQVEGSTAECGAPTDNPETAEGDFNLWGTCTLTVPFEAAQSGTFTIKVVAWGDQAGPEAPMMRISVSDNSPAKGTSVGALAIKSKLIDLHLKLLGESLELGDEELEESYQLLVETWQARMANPNGGWAWSWPDESCYFYLEEQWQEGGVASTAQDETGMLNTWTSVLIYLMTDFYYLHE